MACEIVTGFTGEPHISAEQLGLLNVALVGSGDYLLNTQDKLAATVPTANSITIGTGDVLMQGRHITIPEPETLSIGSGTTGYNRIDLVVIKYTKDPTTGVESVTLEIKQGQAVTGTPAEPSYTTGNIITGGALLNELPIYRIVINGLMPSEPVLLLGNQLSTISTLQSEAAKLITADRIADGAVTLDKLAANSVNSSKIVDGSIATTDIANKAITNDKIADGTIALAKLAANSVNSSKIVDGSIATADLANNSVTTAKIADKNVTIAKLDQSLQNSISRKVLYSNASGGAGAITLNESAANFTLLAIIHGCGANSNELSSELVYSPNGKTVNLKSTLFASDGSSVTLRARNVKISGTSIATSGKSFQATIYKGGYDKTENANLLPIVAVIGVK